MTIGRRITSSAPAMTHDVSRVQLWCYKYSTMETKRMFPTSIEFLEKPFIHPLEKTSRDRSLERGFWTSCYRINHLHDVVEQAFDQSTGSKRLQPPTWHFILSIFIFSSALWFTFCSRHWSILYPNTLLFQYISSLSWTPSLLSLFHFTFYIHE